jgi:hypothetical protein
MKKIILIFLIINICTVAYSQILKGTVADSKTRMPIGFASVYFNGTFVGANSDQQGHFELDVSKNSSMPLTVSAIGYYSVTLDAYSTNELLKVQLEPKDYGLQGVVTQTKSLKKKRQRNLRIFKDEFLGTTFNSGICTILNESDITFNYNSDKDTLKAFASKPLEIDNKALGYKVTYYLDKFEHYKRQNSTFFRGNIIFTEDVASKVNPKHIEENRRNTYLGSRMHFFRTLWLDSLQAKGFVVRKNTFDELKSKNVVIEYNDNKFLKSNQKLSVSYGRSISYINFLKDYVYFDKTGYFDPTGINWQGAMADQRVADWLPNEYWP